MAGLIVLTLFILMAIFAPLLADKDGLRAINALDNDPWLPPSEFAPMGTDSLGRSVWTQFVWGSRISLLVGFAATILAIVHRHRGRRRRRLLRRPHRGRADAA